MKYVLFIVVLSFMIVPIPSQANFATGYCVGMIGQDKCKSDLKKCKEKSLEQEKEIQELKEKIKKLEEQAEAK